MSDNEHDLARSLGRTLCDISQLLESGQDAGRRVRATLGLLRDVVPYEQCALLEAEPGCDPRVSAFPAMQPLEQSELTGALVALFGKMLEKRRLAPQPFAIRDGSHLAVPLIGLDEVIGVLFVRRRGVPYAEPHLRALSLVAAQLAAYLMMLRARAEEIARFEELEQARRTVESAQRAKDQLVGLVAHNLETPLAAAIASLQLLGRQKRGAERERSALILEHGIRIQARLVADLLELASLATPDLRLDLQRVELAASIGAAVEGLRPLAQQRSIQLKAALDASVRPVVADAERFDGVLAILLGNAFTLTPDGGSVTVRLEPAAAGARIQVSDSGRGFSPERLAQLFDDGPGESARSRGADQCTVGLAIARRVVELHGWSIHAESPGKDRGATFTVDLQ